MQYCAARGARPRLARGALHPRLARAVEKSGLAPRSEAPSAREFHLAAAVQQLALCTDSAAIIEVLRVAARSLTDNVDAARTLALLASAMGHEVEVAHDGMAALELARRRPPELVFLDIAMPGMDGHEVARRLRQQVPRSMYLVALTGYGGEEARVRSHAAGFDRHLVKPVDPNALESLLAAA